MRKTGKVTNHLICVCTYMLIVTGLLLTPRPVIAQAVMKSETYPVLNYGSTIIGQRSLQYFVTPSDAMVKSIAGAAGEAEQIYDIAVKWLYVPEKTLNNAIEKWLTPRQFLNDTPLYPGNPAGGEAVSDCEEQANTLVSLLRASGIDAEDVRVVLGRYTLDDGIRGHAWVELMVEGKWLALDPSSGPFWDNDRGMLVNRPGVPFDYYTRHTFPVSQIDLYYNDYYYYEPGGITKDAPLSWLQ